MEGATQVSNTYHNMSGDMKKLKELRSKYAPIRQELDAAGKKSPERMERTVRRIRRHVSTKGFIKEMRKDVEKAGDCIFSDLVREVPLDLEKRRLVLLTLCGFNYRHIALFLDAPPATVSARLTRLKQKCAGYGSPAAERYVDCIAIKSM